MMVFSRHSTLLPRGIGIYVGQRRSLIVWRGDVVRGATPTWPLTAGICGWAMLHVAGTEIHPQVALAPLREFNALQCRPERKDLDPDVRIEEMTQAL